MIDAKNFGGLTAGLVADPERVGNNDQVVRLRLACDYAGSDRANPENKSGYFNGVYFIDDTNPNGKFVKSQLDNGNLKKGSQVQIVYRLQQSRWTTDDGDNRSQVELVIESMTYAGGGRPSEDGATSGGSSSSSSGGSSVPIDF